MVGEATAAGRFSRQDANQCILEMKQGGFQAALALAVPIRSEAGETLGKLVPVGPWILSDLPTVTAISQWRQRFMRMFMVQFESTPDKTAGYLRDLSIGRPDRLFFLIFDASDAFIGHVGIASVADGDAELDNLMRGAKGGHPRLIHYAELAILKWSYEVLRLERTHLRVLSNNWMTIGLHKEVGYEIIIETPLRRRVDGEVIFHDVVEAAESNVKYACTTMGLSRQAFFGRHPWLSGSA